MRNINEIMELHKKAYRGETEYIPLCVKVNNPNVANISRWEMTMNPEKALEFGMENIRLSCEVESDWIPNITNFYQDVLIPGLFGAELFDTEGCNPMPKPLLKDIEEIGELKPHGDILKNSLVKQAVEHFKYLRNNVPEGVEVLAPTITSPLDYAINLRGGDFYLDMLLEPDASRNFLMLLTDLTIQKIKLFKKISGEAEDSYITFRGQCYPGLRVACDSIVNLSPAMIRDFMFPVFNKLGSEFKRLLVHFCTQPAPSTHVLPVLMECPYITGVDNWQGYRTFFKPDGEHILQERLSICTDIPADRLFEELKEPFFTDVKRKGARGLLVGTLVQSVDEGKRLYEKWRNYMK